MLEAYTKRDMSIIKDEMLKLNPREEDYNTLMGAMEKYSQNFQLNYYYYYYLLIDPDVANEDIPMNKFLRLLAPYYNSNMIEESTKNIVESYIYNIGRWRDISPKIYFNDRLVPQFNGTSWDVKVIEDTEYGIIKK